MAAGSLYKDDGDEAITEINVTPFVDIVLVLLIVFMVTAKLIVARGVDIDKPRASSGADVQSTLRVTIDATGTLFVNGDRYDADDAAIARIREIARTTDKPKAVIAGDRNVVYGGVMRAIDLVGQAGITAITLENERPRR